MDPDSKQLLLQLSGELDLNPINLVGQLVVHPTKKYRTRPASKVDMVVVHTTDRDWSIEQLNEYDVTGSLSYHRKVDFKKLTEYNHINKKGIPAITYHECVTADKVYYTLGYDQVSYHAGGYNTRSVAISMVYRTTNPRTNKAEYAPPDDMIKLAQCRAAELCLKFGLSPDRIFGHRELKGTGWDWIRGRRRLLKSCPGPHVDLDLLRSNAAMYMQVKLLLAGFYKGEIDGAFGPQSKAALKGYIG